MGTLKWFPSMTTILLATACYSFNGGDADKALIDNIYKQSQDYDFCITTLGNDPRSETADLRGLAMISISLTVIQIQDTLGRLPDIIKQSTDPLAHQRLGVCQNDYNGSLGNFPGAFNATSNNAFYDTIIFFRMNGTIATSPIAGDDINVFKLAEIILIAIDGLIPKK